jgi:hypothetical protein
MKQMNRKRKERKKRKRKNKKIKKDYVFKLFCLEIMN